MNDRSGTELIERVRATYEAVTTTTAYGSPPPISVDARPTVMPKRALLVAGALLVVLAIVAAVALLGTAGDDARIHKPVPPVDEQSLFPDVAEHKGPELLLAPRSVPAGFTLVYGFGPDATSPATSKGSGTNATLQYWVKLDATGTTPLGAFTINWGPQDLADVEPSVPGRPAQHQDALTAYGNAEPLTVNGHPGVWAEYLQTVAWEQDGRAIAVSASMDNWTGAWPEHLTRADLEALAASAVPDGDGGYRISAPPAGYQVAAKTHGYTVPGIEERRLVYTDGNGRGITIQLVDNTQDPPGAAFMAAVTRLAEVRGQRAVVTQFLNGGDGSGCNQSDMFMCSPMQPGVLRDHYVQWLEPDSTRVTLTGVGVGGDELLKVARSLASVKDGEWHELIQPFADIPCAQTARCGAS
jgi:hypothetical protein